MKTYMVAVVLLLLSVGIGAPCFAERRNSPRSGKARANARPAYIGCWSDASYGVLHITARRIKFGDRGKWVRYADVSRNPDGKVYLLRLFNPGEFNFLSNVVSLSVDGERMWMNLYESLEDFSKGKKVGWDTWHRDKCSAR